MDSKKCCIFAPAIENGGIAQLARAPALQAGGRRFDSDYLHQNPLRRNSERIFLCSYSCELLLNLLSDIQDYLTFALS